MTTPAAFPPSGYVRVAEGVVALESRAGAVAAALGEAPTLAGWAESRAARVVEGGRGPAWRIELGGTPAVVRHYRRGGWMAPLLGDRYFDRPPRPFAELSVSESLRAAGVSTPRILAAAVYPARPGYRADLVTEWLTPGLDLEELLRPGLYPDAERAAAVETAGRAVGRAHAAGLDHPDLRPRNLFLRLLGASGSWDAALLDLDRARMDPDDVRRVEIKKKPRALPAIPREGASRGPRELGAGGRGRVPARLRPCLTASAPRSSSFRRSATSSTRSPSSPRSRPPRPISRSSG